MSQPRIWYHIKSIPHKEHRYETVGDYWVEGDRTEVRVSKLSDVRMEFAVMIHELYEDFACKLAGIDEKTQILPFDLAYEKNRPEGDLSEPGNDPASPYHKQHLDATEIERLVVEKLGLSWDDYERAVDAL